MAGNVLVDTSFLVAFLNGRDTHHDWATTQAARSALPWKTCEPVLAEAFYVLGPLALSQLVDLLKRQAVISAFHLEENLESVLNLLRKYADVPMSLADACLVRMTETLPDPVLLTADSDFGVYRRHGRQVIPRLTPH
jgi:predicted nucleic acid-binding protein